MEVWGLFNKIASSADEALLIKLEERGKEFLMLDLRWINLRRLNKDSRFAKILARHIDVVAYSLLLNDPNMLMIPNDVIQFTKMQQHLDSNLFAM